jgi:hypothetical protein
MTRRETVVRVLLFVAVGFLALGCLLDVIALGVENWAADAGQTEGNPVGHLSVSHNVGLFRTKVEECCLTNSQIVSEWNAVCNTGSANGGCREYYTTSGSYCRFIREKDSSARQGQMDCEQFEAGTIICVILVLASILSAVTVIVLVIIGTGGPGVVSLVSLATTVAMLVVLILGKALIYDNQKQWVQSRYQTTLNLYPPTFDFELGASYKLAAAAFAMWLVSTIIGGAVWCLSRRRAKAAPVPVYQPPIRYPQPKAHVMTPEAPGYNTGNPIAQFGRQREHTMEMCPEDYECPFIDDLPHQLEFAHTCRLPFCTDASAAHRRHFVHQ